MAPKVTVCVLRASDILCEDPSQKQFSIQYSQAKGFLALSPIDAEKEQTYVIDLEKRVAACK